MATANHPDRLAIIDGELRLTTGELSRLADGGAAVIVDSAAGHVVYVGTGGALLSLAMFASARAARTFTPLNYRLSAQALVELIVRLADPLVIADADYLDVVTPSGAKVLESRQFLAAAGSAEPVSLVPEPDDAAVVLFTSGTTSTPKAAELTHANLLSYVTGTVEFGAADVDEAALICVPPYHVAGVSAALSNVYAGRKMVYLRTFDPRDWVRAVADHAITTATVVPTMLDRIVTVLQREEIALPSLRNLAYGGSRVPLPLVRTALGLLPDVGFVNAYGLTETSSTISVLGPEDHRSALAATDGKLAARLGSVGLPVPGIEVQVRSEHGTVLAAGETGELFVRGPQVAGRYSESGSVLDADGWFPTKDRAHLDSDGYLYIEGRGDDTIIRGGENIAPSEIEDALVEHPEIQAVAVVGLDDPQWGQIIVAVVVPTTGSTVTPEDVRAFAREALRGSRTPDRVVFKDALPTNDAGKVLRRQIIAELASTATR